MANRSYLYAHRPGDAKPYRDLSEWKTLVPVAHLLLVSADVEPVQTFLWDVEEKIALRGDAKKGLELFEKFMRWLEPQLDEDFAPRMERALSLLGREDRQGEFYHLELAEIFALSGHDRSEMEEETLIYASMARAIADEVTRLVDLPDATLADTDSYTMSRIAEDYDANLGLYFPGVLYFNAG